MAIQNSTFRIGISDAGYTHRQKIASVLHVAKRNVARARRDLQRDRAMPFRRNRRLQPGACQSSTQVPSGLVLPPACTLKPSLRSTRGSTTSSS